MKKLILATFLFIGAPSFAYNMLSNIFEVLATHDEHNLQQLFRHNAVSVNSVNEQGFTPLHQAAQSNFIEATRLLISFGANLNLQSRTLLNTPLGIAAMKNHLIIANLLLKAGADYFIQNLTGRNPLHLAAAEGNELMVALLIFYAIQHDDLGALLRETALPSRYTAELLAPTIELQAALSSKAKALSFLCQKWDHLCCALKTSWPAH